MGHTLKTRRTRYNEPRNANIVAHYETGATCKQIAEMFHLTSVRVQQILKAAGVWKGKPRAPRQHLGPA